LKNIIRESYILRWGITLYDKQIGIIDQMRALSSLVSLTILYNDDGRAQVEEITVKCFGCVCAAVLAVELL
jgi:hypothetical protein